MKAPCYKCPDRILGCHSDCQRYQEWSEEDRKRKEFLNTGLEASQVARRGIARKRSIKRFCKESRHGKA